MSRLSKILDQDWSKETERLSKERSAKNARQAKEWREKNPERWRALRSKWQKENGNPFNSRANRYRPLWANKDKIKAIYLKALQLNREEGKSTYVVDHIIPIDKELVSGLHVEYNLQIITRSQNLVKAQLDAQYGRTIERSRDHHPALRLQRNN